jgi:hypothetical protein
MSDKPQNPDDNNLPPPSSDMRTVYGSSLPTMPNAQSRSAYFEDMLPGVIASDEREDRLVAINKRRRGGVPLTPDEIRRELKDIITHLASRLMQYEKGFSTFIRNPTHALDYAERVAAYAIKDYPREFQGDPDISGLWDTLKTIHTIGYAWRKSEQKEDGQTVIDRVNKIADDAIQQIYPTVNPHDEPPMTDTDSSRQAITKLE